MKKTTMPLSFARRKIIYLFFLMSVIFTACSDDNDSPNGPDQPVTIYTLKLKSSEKVEFKEIPAGKETISLGDNEERYFGQRIKLACPNELQFNNDSLFIVKPNNIIEKYKIKWQDDELFLHNAIADTWEPCGKKDTNGQFLLNTGFYIKRNHTFVAMGQEYGLTSYSELINNNDKSLSIIWLKMNYVFE